jgi:hypothetical protein
MNAVEVVASNRFAVPPAHLETAEDAFALLGHILYQKQDLVRTLRFDNGRRIISGGPSPEEATDLLDGRLAEYSLSHPGSLEELFQNDEFLYPLALTMTRVQEERRRSGMLRGGSPESLLQVFFRYGSPRPGHFLWRTLRTLAPEKAIPTLYSARRRFLFVLDPGFTVTLFLEMARGLGAPEFQRARPRIAPVLPPEMQDVLEIAAWQGWPPQVYDPEIDLRELDNPENERWFEEARLPDILPEAKMLCQWTTDQIGQGLADYRACSVSALNAFLIANRFLGEGEDVGEVIQRDAATLKTLGVSRHDLAALLRDACLLGVEEMLNPTWGLAQWRAEAAKETDYSVVARQGLRRIERQMQRVKTRFGVTLNEAIGQWEGADLPFTVSYTSFRGHHEDPFHEVDTFYLSDEVGGSADVTITNRQTGESVFLSDMHPYLIRRACFFEGLGAYRLDPAAVCRVLELAPGAAS